MAKYSVNNHSVTIRESYPAREYYQIVDKLRGMLTKTSMSFDEKVGVLSQFVEAWDYPGPVTDIKTWEAMDAIRDLGGIHAAVMDFINERIGALAKNVDDAPTTT
jgi:hypothetical protein